MRDQKEINKKMYAKRREEKLCLWCGKPLDRDGVLCVECNNKNNERSRASKEFYLQIGVCPYCRKRKTTSGHKTCLPCREKISLRHKMNLLDPDKKERIRKKERDKRKRRLEEGLCTKCGKNKAETGYHPCSECRKKIRNYRKAYVSKYQLPDRALWKDQGKCARCGADEQYNGFSLCRKCYEQSTEALERARETVFRHRREERERLEALEAEKMREVKKMFHPRTMEERRNKTDKEGSEKE